MAEIWNKYEFELRDISSFCEPDIGNIMTAIAFTKRIPEVDDLRLL